MAHVLIMIIDTILKVIARWYLPYSCASKCILLIIITECYVHIQYQVHVHCLHMTLCMQATRVARENLEKVIKRGDNLSDLHDRAGIYVIFV